MHMTYKRVKQCILKLFWTPSDWVFTSTLYSVSFDFSSFDFIFHYVITDILESKINNHNQSL